jgi:hypothetical protein
MCKHMMLCACDLLTDVEKGTHREAMLHRPAPIWLAAEAVHGEALVSVVELDDGADLRNGLGRTPQRQAAGAARRRRWQSDTHSDEPLAFTWHTHIGARTHTAIQNCGTLLIGACMRTANPRWRTHTTSTRAHAANSHWRTR